MSDFTDPLYYYRPELPPKAGEPRLPFITGSVAYGTPHHVNSDLDVVMMVDSMLRFHLGFIALDVDENKYYGDEENIKQLKFAKLNLILCSKEEEYEAWRLGTTFLMENETPCTRKRAVEVIKTFMSRLGLIHCIECILHPRLEYSHGK